MSTSVTATAAWGQTSAPTADTGSTSSRPRRAAASRRSNGQDNQQSLSPAPSASTLSTRSKAFARSDSGRLESPEKLDVTLPTSSTSTRATRRNSRSATEASDLRHTNGVAESAKIHDQDGGFPTTEFMWSPGPTSLRSPTPDPAPHQGQPAISAETVVAGTKRKLPVDDDISLVRNGESSYEVTPLTSPVEANVDLPTAGASGTQTPRDNAAPKRAPRKKRKWLKKGEVDPDDVVAVAKQKERHMLIDQACDKIDAQMEAVRNGSDPTLQALLEELCERRDRQLARTEKRKEHHLAELDRQLAHTIDTTRAQFEEQSEKLLETLRVDLRHFKHKLFNERAQYARAQAADEKFRARRSGRPWGQYPKTQLLSAGTERTLEYEVEGEVRERRPLASRIGVSASQPELDNDLRAIRQAMAQNDRSASPPKRKAPPSAKPPADSPREIYLNGYKHKEYLTAPPRPTSSPPVYAPPPGFSRLVVAAPVPAPRDPGPSRPVQPSIPQTAPRDLGPSRPAPVSMPQTASRDPPSSRPVHSPIPQTGPRDLGPSRPAHSTIPQTASQVKPVVPPLRPSRVPVARLKDPDDPRWDRKTFIRQT